MTTHTRPGQSGFSMIELMIAMVITGIVSLSIYAVMAQSQSAFQRQPAFTDRQQNGRIAIDLIEGDIASAGRGLPLVSQAFTDGLDALNPPGIPGNPNSDELEIVIADTSCPSHLVCSGASTPGVPPAVGTVGVAGAYDTREAVGAPPTCLNPAVGTRPLVVLADALNFSVHRSTAAGPGSACPVSGVAGNNGSVTLGPALPGVGPVPPWPFAGPAPSAITMYVARVVRYRLADTNGDGFLSLERNESGLEALGVWQIVARGIDDLQVQYQTGVPGPLPDGWRDTPGVIAACVAPPPLPGGCTVADYNAAVRNVRVTISARTADDAVMGAGPGNEFRGQLTTIATPRAVVAALEVATMALPGYPVFN